MAATRSIEFVCFLLIFPLLIPKSPLVGAARESWLLSSPLEKTSTVEESKYSGPNTKEVGHKDQDILPPSKVFDDDSMRSQPRSKDKGHKDSDALPPSKASSTDNESNVLPAPKILADDDIVGID
ncbi:hypothetical protein POM88_023639 [Heracleum sosnowskyi]|uniref:Uncharacterized protein n=1 Tax=Heracleum sosnowskyi TaxID=360622 RepID=A0AAD8IJ43_9APIA|nr:hypothetical protein POM88_023639 [Heracleum sosnowskyi]